MKPESPCNKPAPRALEKPVLSLIGIFSLIFVPFCFLFVGAMLYGIFGPANQKFKIPIYFELSFAALFSVLGIMLAVAGGRLIRSKESQREDLITTFYPWLRRVGWLFAGSFALDGILNLFQSNYKGGISQLIAALIVLFMTRSRQKIEKKDDKNCQQSNRGDGD